jgi:hypothetical protein
LTLVEVEELETEVAGDVRLVADAGVELASVDLDRAVRPGRIGGRRRSPRGHGGGQASSSSDGQHEADAYAPALRH